MPVPINPGLPRKQASQGTSIFRTRLPVTRTKSSMNHSMQKPIALCANANGPPFAARGAGGGVDEERGACDLEAMMSIVIFAASGGLRETARGDLPLQLTGPPSDPH